MRFSLFGKEVHIGKWTLLTLLGLASHQIIEEVIRPKYGIGEGAWPFLLGVAPNFLAAALIFPFAGLMYWESTGSDPQKRDRFFYFSLLGSQVGLVLWEYMQLTGNLIFDPWDIVATLIGGFSAFGVYFFLK